MVQLQLFDRDPDWENSKLKPKKWAFAKEIKDVPMIALTATATPKVQSDIQKNLQMNDAIVFKSSFNRSNLYYEVRPKLKKADTLKEIVQFIKIKKHKSGIIYCLSRKKVEDAITYYGRQAA